MIPDAVSIALIGVLVAMIPTATTLLVNRQAAKIAERKQILDQARADDLASRTIIAANKVATQAEKTAALLALNQDSAARAARDVAVTLASSTKVTNDKIDVIHTLVNSTLTKSKQSELEETESSLAVMLELIDIKKKLGEEPTEAVLSAVAVKRAKIAELGVQITDRLAQTAEAEKQIESQKPRNPPP